MLDVVRAPDAGHLVDELLRAHGEDAACGDAERLVRIDGDGEGLGHVRLVPQGNHVQHHALADAPAAHPERCPEALRRGLEDQGTGRQQAGAIRLDLELTGDLLGRARAQQAEGTRQRLVVEERADHAAQVVADPATARP